GEVVLLVRVGRQVVKLFGGPGVIPPEDRRRARVALRGGLPRGEVNTLPEVARQVDMRGEGELGVEVEDVFPAVGTHATDRIDIPAPITAVRGEDPVAVFA